MTRRILVHINDSGHMARMLADALVADAMISVSNEPEKPEPYMLTRLDTGPDPVSGLTKRHKRKGRGRHKRERWSS